MTLLRCVILSPSFSLTNTEFSEKRVHPLKLHYASYKKSPSAFQLHITSNRVFFPMTLPVVVEHFLCSYLEYAAEHICDFLRSRNVTEVLFVPYALRDQVPNV